MTKLQTNSGKKPCGCIEKVNKEMWADEVTSNTCIDTVFRHNFLVNETVNSVHIATRKKNPRDRRKAVTLFPTFCPFCGQKIF